MMIYTGFKYVTIDKVVNLGSVKIEKEKDHFVQWSPILGAMLIVGGVIITVRNRKKLTLVLFAAFGFNVLVAQVNNPADINNPNSPSGQITPSTQNQTGVG